MRSIEEGGFRFSMLQNPSDPYAAFCEKAGKEHQGYVANLEEIVGEKGSVITVAEGNLDVEIGEKMLSYKDETGELSRAMLTLRDALKSTIQEIADELVKSIEYFNYSFIS